MWEKIPDNIMNSERIKIPGGWVVRSHDSKGGVSQIIVIDSIHIWKLDTHHKIDRSVEGEHKFAPQKKAAGL